MKSSQILVRAMSINDLKNFRHTGVLLGKYCLVFPKEIELEINRRERNSRDNRYLNLETDLK